MKITNTRIKTIRADGIYADDTVLGLKLRVRDGRKYWIFRRSVSGKRIEVSIGTDDLDIDKVHDLALYLRGLKNDEFVSEAKRIKYGTVNTDEIKTFEQVEREFYQWNIDSGNFVRGDSYDLKRYYVIRKHVLPAIGKRDINTITPEDVSKILIAIWDKPETVKRTIFMLKELFNWAKSRKMFKGECPADKKGELKFLLPKKKKDPRNHGALPLNRVAPFCLELWKRGERSDLLFLFAILTCMRSKPARFARWEQIDIKERTWTIPSSEMKIRANGDIVVPLSDAAMRVLERVGVRESGLIFPCLTHGLTYSVAIFQSTVISMNEAADKKGLDRWIDVEQTNLLGREIRATQHGISRACFKTWSDCDEFNNDLKYNERVVEACLHHSVDDGYGGAYNRGKLLIRRRELLNDWGKFCFEMIESEMFKN